MHAKNSVWVEVYNPSDKPLTTHVLVHAGKAYLSNLRQETLAPLAGQALQLGAYERVCVLVVR